MSRRPRQSEAILAKVYANHAWCATGRQRCVVEGCDGECAGWLTSGELHQIGMSPRSRLAEFRKEGWVIDFIEKDSAVDGIFHFVRQVPMQQDLETGEELRYIGEIPVGVGGKMIEFYEVGR